MTPKLFSRISQSTNSLSINYLYKLAGNIGAAAANFFVQAIVLRGLGPENYGAVNFIQNTALQFLGFFDAGASQWLSIGLSQSQASKSSLLVYFKWSGIIFFIGMIMFVLTNIFPSIYQEIWPNQFQRFVIFGVPLFSALYFFNVGIFFLDSFGFTKLGSKILLLSKITTLLIFLFFWKFSALSPKIFALTIAFSSALPALIIFLFIYSKLQNSNPIDLTTRKEWKENRFHDDSNSLKVLFQYSKPFLLSSVIFFLCNYYDRWILNKYYGNAQMGYFGIANQIGQACFLFSGAFASLIPRELGTALRDEDHSKVKNTFSKQMQVVFFFSSIFCIFCALFAESLVRILGGKNYSQANMATSIMCLYPIHQCIGHFASGYLIAIKQNKLNIIVNMLVFILGCFLSFVFLYPSSSLPQLGSIGIALKMLIVQLLANSIILFFVCRKINLSFRSILLEQWLIIFHLSLIACFTRFLFLGQFSGFGKFVEIGFGFLTYISFVYFSSKILAKIFPQSAYAHSLNLIKKTLKI